MRVKEEREKAGLKPNIKKFKIIKLKQGLCINLEGWDGEGDGREFQKAGDIKQQNSVKQLSFNKK